MVFWLVLGLVILLYVKRKKIRSFVNKIGKATTPANVVYDLKR